jgi:divalent metal cation (Fe/Co/Zn/Cd) transporter
VVTGAALRRDDDWRRLARWTRRLAWASLLWMTVEGAVGLAAGVGAGSVALVGWALSSGVEGLASVVVIWRFSGARTMSDGAEDRARRVVAVSFWLLAPFVAVESVRDLATGHRAAASAVGIALTAGSLVLMPALGVAKRRLGARLGSGATAGEGSQNLLCAALAAGVLAGLLGNGLWGWWWLDPAVGLVVAVAAVREGRAAWRGESCCAAPAVAPGGACACGDGCACAGAGGRAG